MNVTNVATRATTVQAPSEPASDPAVEPEQKGGSWTGPILLGGMMVAGMGFLIADMPGRNPKLGLAAGGIAGLVTGAGLLYAGISKATGPAESTFGETDGKVGKYLVGPGSIALGGVSVVAGVALLAKALR